MEVSSNLVVRVAGRRNRVCPAAWAPSRRGIPGPSATTGEQKAAAIAAYPVNTTNGYAVSTTVINGHAVIRLADLTWNASATQAQIDQAQRDLAVNLIKFR